MNSNTFFPAIAETVSNFFTLLAPTPFFVTEAVNNLFDNITRNKMEAEANREKSLSRNSSASNLSFVTISTESDIQELVRDVGGSVVSLENSILNNQVMNAQNFQVTENLVQFFCPMCDELCLPNNGIVLHGCQHSFCRSCIKLKIFYSEDTNVKCFLQNGDKTCDSNLLEPEIKAVLEPDEFRDYLKRKILQVENAIFCGTIDCMGWCILKDAVEKFHCSVCNNYNCFQCDKVSEFEECPFCAQVNGPGRNVSGPVLEYDALYQLYQDDTVCNLEKFQCPICLSDFDTGEGVTLKECLHNFCRPCLTRAVDCSDDPEVKCPFGDGVVSCDNVLSQREVNALVPPEIFEKYLARSLIIAERQMGSDAFHCKHPDCTGWGIKYPGVIDFQCEVCRHINCINCEDIHEGVSCDIYKTTKHLKKYDSPTVAVLQHMLASNTGMPCPKCRIMITKTEGCDGMQCTACKTHICWATKGPRWGPNGVGDTTGGCRCNVNNKKCHVDCRNCH